MHSRSERFSWGRMVTGLIGIVIGVCITLILVTLAVPRTAAVGATIATTTAVVVALAVGLLPWFIAWDDRRTRSTVVASRILHELEGALHAAGTVRDGVGHAAETKDPHRIQIAAKRCLPVRPEKLEEMFENLGAFPRVDALVVCTGVMAAIDLYAGVHAIADLDLRELLEALRMQVVSDSGGDVHDLEKRAASMQGEEMMKFARMAAARAMDAQTRIPPALAILRRSGATAPRAWTEFQESPVPEVAEAMRLGRWPPPSPE